MASEIDKNEERRKRVFVGTLPPDFLRISGTETEPMSSQEQQVAADAQAALALQQQMSGAAAYTSFTGRLSITVAQAKLVKNYGMTRMDPYVRLRVGHSVYETHTDPNGGKNPRWNKVVQCLLPQGVNSIYLEIYDECSFTMDELIAWTQIPIPQNVLNGETHEDWFPLNGKQGEGMEGMINLVLSFGQGPLSRGFYGMSPIMVPSSACGLRPFQGSIARPVPVTYVPATVPVVEPVLQLSAEDLKLVEEMFPNIDKEVVKSVYEANRGNKDTTVNSLLQMSD